MGRLYVWAQLAEGFNVFILDCCKHCLAYESMTLQDVHCQAVKERGSHPQQGNANPLDDKPKPVVSTCQATALVVIVCTSLVVRCCVAWGEL